VRRLAHMDDVHRPVFPENARSNRLVVLSADPYDQPASLQLRSPRSYCAVDPKDSLRREVDELREESSRLRCVQAVREIRRLADRVAGDRDGNLEVRVDAVGEVGTA